MATKRTTKKNAALPDSVEDQTNIGERNHGAGETTIRTEDPVREPVDPPQPASEPDKPIDVKGDGPAPAPEPDTDLIRVRGVGPADHYVVAEVNPRHPNGQAVIRGGEEAEVARTFRIMDAVYAGRLEIV